MRDIYCINTIPGASCQHASTSTPSFYMKGDQTKTWSWLRWSRRRWGILDWSEEREPERAAARGPSAATPLFNRSLPPVETSTSFSPQVCRLISFYTCGDKIDSLLIPVFPLAVTSPAAEPVAARLTSVRRRKRCRGRPGTEGEGRGRRDPTGPQM